MSLFMALALLCFFLSTTKENRMEGRQIDKIDVKREHKDLIALYYKIELRALLQRLFYEHSLKGSIKF